MAAEGPELPLNVAPPAAENASSQALQGGLDAFDARKEKALETE